MVNAMIISPAISLVWVERVSNVSETVSASMTTDWSHQT
jgi:hypothetical protein